jgi:hypothetical protein
VYNLDRCALGGATDPAYQAGTAFAADVDVVRPGHQPVHEAVLTLAQLRQRHHRLEAASYTGDTAAETITIHNRVLLGVLTYLRLVETAIEDLFYARAINRIRRHYLDLGPDVQRWFLLAGCDDPHTFMVNMGPGRSGNSLAPPSAIPHRDHGVTSIIIGVLAALIADAATA